MINIIISFCLGCLATWLFSHLYYGKAKRESQKWFCKNIPKMLNSEVKSIILSKPEDVNWSVEEIIKLYQHKIFEQTGLLAKNELGLLYCPQCGSEKLKESSIELDYILKCLECGWYEKIFIPDIV